MKAIIALEDGRIFEGRSFTGPGEAVGEIVFNTSMTGYQEILTDPSYRGQIVTMTYPLIGNYGVNDEDEESSEIHLSAFVVREYEEAYSNWRAKTNLREYLQRHSILGIEQVDTRAVTRHIRVAGAMKAVISTEVDDPQALVARAKESPGLIGRDLVKEVSCTRPYLWKKRPVPLDGEEIADVFRSEPGDFKVAVLDCGLKYNQLRIFEKLGCTSLVFPHDTPAEAMLECDPDGIFLSNGPGDPAALSTIIETVRGLLGRRPVFGICLGHQVLSLALGAKTYKLKFGHRGANQPVKELATGKIEITSQNHGFAVDEQSIPEGVEVTHINLNDTTVEGIKHAEIPAFSVQYHPENAPGPHDAEYLFDRFIQMMAEYKS